MDECLKSRLGAMRDFLEEAKHSFHDGVPGIFVQDSGLPGPTVGVTVLTHGNEIAGLDVVRRIAKGDALKGLTCGRVVMVVNNLLAAEKFLTMAAMGMPVDEGTRLARYLDVNMNRLPGSLEAAKAAYEVLRARELRPVWRTFDYGIDLHSVHASSRPPFIVSTMAALDEYLLVGLPGEDIITNITEVQIGKPVCYFYGDTNSKCLAFEGGQHYEIQTIQVSLAAALQFCRNAGVLPFEEKPRCPRKIWKVINSVVAADKEFTLLQPLQEYQQLKQGDPLTHSLERSAKAEVLQAPCDGFVILAPPRHHLKPQKVGEEWFFIAEPAQLRMT